MAYTSVHLMKEMIQNLLDGHTQVPFEEVAW